MPVVMICRDMSWYVVMVLPKPPIQDANELLLNPIVAALAPLSDLSADATLLVAPLHHCTIDFTKERMIEKMETIKDNPLEAFFVCAMWGTLLRVTATVSKYLFRHCSWCSCWSFMSVSIPAYIHFSASLPSCAKKKSVCSALVCSLLWCFSVSTLLSSCETPHKVFVHDISDL